jgi:hypothetical protein
VSTELVEVSDGASFLASLDEAKRFLAATTPYVAALQRRIAQESAATKPSRWDVATAKAATVAW